MLRTGEGDHDARELLLIAERTRDPRLLASAHSALANAATGRRDYQRAAEMNDRAATLCSQTGDHVMLSRTLNNSSDCALNLGDFDRAAAFASQALQSARTAENLDGVAAALGNLGSALLALGRAEEAAARFSDSLRYAEQTGAPEDRAYAIEGLGVAAAAASRPHEATRLLAAAHTALRELACELDNFEAGRHEVVIGELRDDLGDGFAAAWNAGLSTGASELLAAGADGFTPAASLHLSRRNA